MSVLFSVHNANDPYDGHHTDHSNKWVKIVASASPQFSSNNAHHTDDSDHSHHADHSNK